MSGAGDSLLALFAFLLGAVVGSFANVCIHRLPRGESVISPASHCPSCGKAIAFHDNVPIVGWLFVRGRCRSCGARVSARYPLVELAVALLFLGAFLRWGLAPATVAAALLSAASVILIATDLEARILPDEVTLGTLALGLALDAAADAAGRHRLSWGESDLLEALAGAALGASVLLAVRFAYQALRGVEGMGLGDVKMIAMIGALTGPAGVLLSLFFGSVSGALLGGVLLLVRTARWSRARRLARAGRLERAAVVGGGLVLDEGGRVVAAGPRWSEIPGGSSPGAPPALALPVGRPMLALLRLGRRRARAGKTTFTGRLVLEDEESFFRVLAARVERMGEGRTLLLLSRADIPFGVFLALGALAAFAFGRPALALLFGDIPVPAARLLP
ncbi:MAG TPA: prepilin peptidase [Thermoanaerobaculia bacterium]|nr:prepilin peptidase [Thermoanaerobaculia bacterium]